MSHSTWEIPEAYQPLFAEKTLILCFSHRSAIVYIAHKHEMHLHNPIETDATNFHYSDKEGMSFSRGSGIGSSPGTEEHNDEHYQKVFLNYFAETFRTLVEKEQIAQCILFVPDDLKNAVKEKIPAELVERTHIYGGNVVNFAPIDLLKRIHS